MATNRKKNNRFKSHASDSDIYFFATFVWTEPLTYLESGFKKWGFREQIHWFREDEQTHSSEKKCTVSKISWLEWT